MLKIIFHSLLFICCLVYAKTTITGPSISDQDNKLKFHAIYSEELREIMRRMNQLVFEKELNELQKMEARVQHLRNLIDTVNELVVASESLTEALPGFELSHEEREIFYAMAKQLQIEANNIRKTAEETDYTYMDIAYQRLNDTCAACHELFRF